MNWPERILATLVIGFCLIALMAVLAVWGGAVPTVGVGS